MKASSIILLVLGIIIIFLGLNGSLGTAVGSLIVPSKVELREGSSSERQQDIEEKVDQAVDLMENRFGVDIPKI